MLTLNKDSLFLDVSPDVEEKGETNEEAPIVEATCDAPKLLLAAGETENEGADADPVPNVALEPNEVVLLLPPNKLDVDVLFLFTFAGILKLAPAGAEPNIEGLGGSMVVR